MRKLFTIATKELKRFFTDPRMLVTLLLPGLLIFAIYSLMGSFLKSASTVPDTYTYSIYVENGSPWYESNKNSIYGEKTQFSDDLNKMMEDKDPNAIKEKLKNKEIDLYIVFPDNFDPTSAKGKDVEIFYNSVKDESIAIYQIVSSYFNYLSMSEVEPNFRINSVQDTVYDMASKEDMTAKMVTMLLPYLVIIFLFSGCMAISTESIAGEKERGTIATLLVTPTKRRVIALGKIIALSVTSLVSALVSFGGVMASLPKLLGGDVIENVPSHIYSFWDYVGILGVIVVTVIFFTTLLSILSTFAKNVKEASQWSSLLMVVVMLLGITSMLGVGSIPTNPFMYLIPVYNSVQCMSSIFALKFNESAFFINFFLTLISNCVYIGIGVWGLAKMFNSEKIMSHS